LPPIGAKRSIGISLLIAMHGVALMNAGYGPLAYPLDRSSDPRVKAYIEHQNQLRLKLMEQLRESDEFRPFASDDQVWANYELIEVYDQFEQFICNRQPLNNSKARRLGPTPTLNEMFLCR
jgi:hypothetical protein